MASQALERCKALAEKQEKWQLRLIHGPKPQLSYLLELRERVTTSRLLYAFILASFLTTVDVRVVFSLHVFMARKYLALLFLTPPQCLRTELCVC